VVAADLVEAGARRLTARMIPTKKNAPVRDFLPRHGFVASSAAPGDGPGEAFVKQPLPGPPFEDDHIAAHLDQARDPGAGSAR
jgi:hypothetical protein